MIRRGEAETLEIRQRESRLKPFLVGITSYAVGIVVMATTGTTAVSFLVALALLYPINTALIVLINLRWKISVHMTSLAGFVSILLFVSLTVWRDFPPATEAVLTALTVAPLLVLLPLLMWARVRVGAHTLGQVVAGALFGLIVPVVRAVADRAGARARGVESRVVLLAAFWRRGGSGQRAPCPYIPVPIRHPTPTPLRLRYRPLLLIQLPVHSCSHSTVSA